MQDPERILVIRRKAIGDVVVSMAVPRALRARWPGAQITVVVDRFAAPVVQGAASVDHVLVYDRRAQARGSWWQRLRAFVAWMRELRAIRADLAIDLMATPQTALWTRISGAPVRVGLRRRLRTWAYTHHVERETEPRFAGERFLDWVRVLGIDPGPWTPSPLPKPASTVEQVQRAVAELPKPRVVLNPSATWPAKGWPTAHFGELARRLREAGVGTVLVAWGPGEETLRDAVVRESGDAAAAMPATDLPGLATWLDAMDLVVTTDSGPKHVAVAEGTPTLTLFGSTSPLGWQPPGARHAWLTHPAPCHPCNRLECNVSGHPCLDLLLPSTVAARAMAMLESPTRVQEDRR